MEPRWTEPESEDQEATWTEPDSEDNEDSEDEEDSADEEDSEDKEDSEDEEDSEDQEATWTEPVPSKEEISKLLAEHRRQCSKLNDTATTSTSFGCHEGKQLSINQVKKKLKSLIRSLDSGGPLFSMILRHKDNTTFRPCSDGVKRLAVRDINHRRKPKQKRREEIRDMCKLILKRLRKRKNKKTQREMFYKLDNLWAKKETKKGSKKRTNVYDLLDDICCHIMCSRSSICVDSLVEGRVGGLLKWKQNGATIDAKKRVDGTLIPDMCSKVVLMNCGAEFILVLEKHCVLVDLMAKKFYKKYPCIMVTGLGTPGMPDRRFLKLLETLGLTMFGLFDGDVAGIRMFSIYAFGSHEKAFDSVELACPQMKWLGIWPTDISKLDISSQKLCVYKDRLLDGLLAEEFVTEVDNPKLYKELKHMKETKRTTNLTALDDKFGDDWVKYVPYQIKRVLTEKSTD